MALDITNGYDHLFFVFLLLASHGPKFRYSEVEATRGGQEISLGQCIFYLTYVGCD